MREKVKIKKLFIEKGKFEKNLSDNQFNFSRALKLYHRCISEQKILVENIVIYYTAQKTRSAGLRSSGLV